MRKFAYLLAFVPLFASATVDMTRINPELFLRAPQTDLGKITISNDVLKRSLVSYLFDHDLLNHEGTKAFTKDAPFAPYYQQFQSRYRLIDLNHDNAPELVFEGFVSKDDDREHLEIYRVENGVPKKIYDELGHVLAYIVQPNTQEVLLFHHQYPCCLNASHNIDRLRFVENKMQAVKRYFVARKAGDMKGPFFPAKVTFTAKSQITKKIVELRWSGSVIQKDAWFGRAPENLVARYDTGSVYKVLSEENNWYFVLMHTPPKVEANKVVNPANLTETAVYGWLDKRKL
jgi:hypothetical protein